MPVAVFNVLAGRQFDGEEISVNEHPTQPRGGAQIIEYSAAPIGSPSGGKFVARGIMRITRIQIDLSGNGAQTWTLTKEIMGNSVAVANGTNEAFAEIVPSPEIDLVTGDCVKLVTTNATNAMRMRIFFGGLGS